MKVLAACLLAAAQVALCSSTEAADRYLCVSDGIVGFNKDNSGEWTRALIKGTLKYTIDKASTNFKTLEYIVSELDTGKPVYFCSVDDNPHVIICGTEVSNFTMNVDTLKFYETNTASFMRNQNTGSQARLAIGSCNVIR